MRDRGAKRREPDTLWRLVDSRCKQLGDAVAAARIPFLFALTWAFVWAWALYTAEHGYMDAHVKEMKVLHSEVQSRAPEAVEYWQQLCKIYLVRVRGETPDKLQKLSQEHVGSCLSHFAAEGKDAMSWLSFLNRQSTKPGRERKPYSPAFINRCVWHSYINDNKDLYDRSHLLSRQELQACDDYFRERLPSYMVWAGGVLLESRLVSFPFNLGKITISDLCILGQAGLLLILAWAFFALRRENHALVSLVDLDRETQKRAVCTVLAYLFLPKWLGRLSYGIVPQDRYLSAEHLAYANHITAQRFLFIFSRRARPLLKTTLFLGFLPVLVAVWNLGTDIRDMLRMGSTPVPTVQERVLLETFMLIGVIVVTARTMWFAMHSAVVLNGWHLATRVWMEEWDERTQDPASPVIVNALGQQVRKSNNNELSARSELFASANARCCAACQCIEWKPAYRILPRLWRLQFKRFFHKIAICTNRVLVLTRVR